MSAPWDYVLVGGGLQNGLIALAVLSRQPDARLVLLEQGEALGGNHTWSFHEATVPAALAGILGRLTDHRWDRYRVQFPGLSRVVEHGYATISSEHFHDVVSAAIAAAPNAALRLGAHVASVSANAAVLADGEEFAGRCVVSALGPESGDPPSDSGFQKFVGLELELGADVDATTADLIDATVPQRGGFRFVYVLPFSPRRVLVEDTVFSNDPMLDYDAMKATVLAYCKAHGLVIERILREESGVLPMPWRPTAPAPATPPLQAGFAGGWFHPATGYSVPVAARLAEHVMTHGPDDVFGPELARLIREQSEQARFAYLLNELLFRATKPEGRVGVFEHFYELSDDIVLRFYGLTLTREDRVRMFLRRPPKGVSYARAMRVLPGWMLPWSRK